MAEQAKTMDGTDWGLLVFLSILWGGAFFFAGIAVKELSPFVVVLVRVSVAALCLLPLFFYFKHSLPKSLKDWWPFIMMGLLNNALPFGFIFWGQTYITVGLSSIINAMTPLFAVLILAAFGDEKLTIPRLIGVLLGVVGVAVLRGFDGSIPFEQTIGIILCLLGTVAYGFAALWGRRFLSGVAPIKSATCQLIGSTLIMALVVVAIEEPWNLTIPSSETLLSLLGLAVFATAIAYIVFFKILVRAGASNVMLVTLLIPISALALGNLFLGEEIKAKEIYGALIIGAGLLFIDGRFLTLFSKRKA